MNTTSAQVAEARARLARLEAAQQRKEEIAVLEAQEKRAEAMLQLSTAELERQKQLTAKSRRNAGSARHRDGKLQPRQGGARRSAPADHGRAALRARGGHRGGAPVARRRARRGELSAETKLARRKLVSPVSGAVQQIYFRPGEMVPAGRPVLSILPPGNIKVRFFVGEAAAAEGHARRRRARSRATAAPSRSLRSVSFIARAAEYTPPVIYSLEERNKLVFMVEARAETAGRLARRAAGERRAAAAPRRRSK